MSRKLPLLVLASGSKARRAMMVQAGLDFEICPADLDEAAYRAAKPSELALMLAQEKARVVAEAHDGALVIGSDQVLDVDGVLYDKAKDLIEAQEKLLDLRGKTHTLSSAVSVVRGEEILWSCVARARLTMRDFTKEQFDSYVKKNESALLSCVGGYEIEAAGAWLFSKIEGDVFTIMGMPLLPLLSYLQDEHGFLP